MSYREKIAWLSLIAIAVTFGPYFTFVAGSPPSETQTIFRQLSPFAMTAFVQMLILGVGHLYLRRTSPPEDRTPLDERDRAIMHRSVISAYYVLMAGMILVGVVMPFTESGWAITNAALFMIIVAEVVYYGIVVFSYRRHA